MACGKLDSSEHNDVDPCGTQCPIYNGTWYEYFKPVFKQSVIDFLGEIVNHAFPVIVTKDSLTDLL